MNGYEVAWAAIILYCIVMYVILDGFTLGTGFMLPFLDDDEADIAMSVILPTWDGNQTWLVLGLACLYGAFPLAFSILMPALYLPLLLMGIGLLFRGVAFEFRLKSKGHKYAWSVVFCIASLSVAFIQGAIAGNFVLGFDAKVVNGILTVHHFMSGFSIFTAISLMVGYMLLGTSRLILKTQGKTRDTMYRVIPIFTALFGLCIFIVSVWTPFVNPLVAEKWLNLHLWPYLVSMPAITGAAFLILAYAILKKLDHLPYWAAVIMFLCPYAGIATSVYPYIVPYQLPYWQAASAISSLRFTLIGACILLPILSAYTYYSYHVFKGKITDVLSY